jgi:hypothetical protein
MKPLWFFGAAVLIVVILIVLTNQQGLAIYTIRTFLHGGR